MRSPEEIRQRNHRLDIWAYTILVLQVVAAVVNGWFGSWWLVVLLAIAFVITWRVTRWRQSVLRDVAR